MLSTQAIHSPWLDKTIILCNAFDTITFYLLLIAIIWYGYDRKCGIRLFFLFTISLAVNSLCKEVFGQPRPFSSNPSMALLHSPSFGFPSGGAQNMMALFLFLAFSVRKAWLSSCSFFFIALVSFSRIYLGLHYPSDVVGGWIIGATLFSLYSLTIQKIELILSQKNSFANLALGVLIVIIFWQLKTPYPHLRTAFTLLIPGCSLGLLFGPQLSINASPLQRLSRILLSVIGIVAILWSNTSEISCIQFFFTGAWISWGTPVVCRALSQKHNGK